jgi:RNA polymerase sigma factor (sigma-70 family)
MTNCLLNGVVRNLRRAALPQTGGRLSDGELLERFLATREEAAFESLVRRHGPMVLAVCRRLLNNWHDAEDAFQATFLVFAIKASSVAARESLGSWLHGVAYRTAQKALASAARRRAKEKKMARPEALWEQDDPAAALRLVIDEELSRLAEKYREPVILCDLQGLTRKEAAHRLGCPEGTVSGRLARARGMLAKRLARRGFALSGGAATALFPNAVSACVPAPLLLSTVRAAALLAAGHAAAGVISAPVAALTKGVLTTMCLNKTKLALAVVAAVGLLVTGWGVYETRAQAVAQPAAGARAVPAPIAAPPAQEAEKLNLPTTPPLTQVLASLDADNKVTIKTVQTVFRRLPNVPPGGGAPAPAMRQLQSQKYALDDIEVLDTAGKKLDKKEVMKHLKKETVALASLYGQKVDPLHLRVLKDGVLIFVLPAPAGRPGLPGGVLPGQPLPAPGLPAGGGVIPVQPALPAPLPGAVPAPLPRAVPLPAPVQGIPNPPQ